MPRVYLPGVQALTPAVLAEIEDCTCLLIDGTCWRDDELIRLGLAGKTSQDMGHLPSAVPAAAWRSSRLPCDGRSSSTSTTPTRSCSTTRPNGASCEHSGMEVAVDGLEVEVQSRDDDETGTIVQPTAGSRISSRRCAPTRGATTTSTRSTCG